MAITIRRKSSFGRFGRLDWKLVLGAMVLAAMVAAGAIYLASDGDTATPVAGTTTSNTIGADAGQPAVVPAPAATDFVAAPATAPVVYIVGSEDQLRRMQLGIAEADVIRYSEGLAPLGGEVLIVPEGGDGGFFAGMDEANTIRAAHGLAPLTVVDLR